MLSAWVVLASFSYAALLFGIAWIGDKYHPHTERAPWRPIIYSLALAVYCSSWTFYGAVGSAVRYGWGYLPIYLGPLLLLLFGWRIIERLSLVAQSQNTVSIADFMASRYGRSQRLAALVAFMAVIACVPYLALQYKAVSLSLDTLTGRDFKRSLLQDPTLYIAVIMALFSILFGTRQVDATEHRPGLMLAVAFESLVKLITFIAVGIFAFLWANKESLNPQAALSTLVANTPPVGFLGQTLLAFTAVVLLPRQFHVAIVECNDASDIRRARWLFGTYLVLVSIMVLPIASVGLHVFGHQGSVTADSFVLALPLIENNMWLALAAYIGGFSAATGMVIVTSVALSIMVSNDLIMPLWLRHGSPHQGRHNISRTMLWVRRLAILFIAATAYAYYYSSASDRALSAYGLITFAAVIQFAPGLIGGLYWQGASRTGVEVGLFLGFLMWLYTLFLPTLTESGWLPQPWLEYGPWGLAWLKPTHLFGLFDFDPLSHGTFWSLAVNITAMLWISWRRPPSLAERLNAQPFLDPYSQRPALAARLDSSHILVKDLITLAARILGENKSQWAFEQQARKYNIHIHDQLAADSHWLQFTELLLAGAVGAASARLVLTSALRGSGLEVATVVSLLDEAGQELRFNRDILLTTIENMDQGVSVVDANMCLVAWNHSYEQLFNYPAGMLRVGRHIADLIRYNAEQGKIAAQAEEDIEAAIERRIGFMRAGTSHTFQRTMNNNRVIELKGRPLPGGGYVTSYNDVTEYKRVEGKLREINEHLEQRVAERTREAEIAQASRVRFLSAVSHDVLQPMNAARLFASSLHGSKDAEEMRNLADKIDSSLQAAEELLDGLLDISHLDAGALKPELSAFDGRALLEDLLQQYKPIAKRRELSLRLYMPPLMLYSDASLLRRVLQNFISNALRYTHKGRILIAGRRRGEQVELQVWDTGQGIPPHHLQHIYTEFHRFDQEFDWGERGMGLGLSICQRIAFLLNHSLSVDSTLGKGSVFSITVPLATTEQQQQAKRPRAIINPQHNLQGLRVLCVDNDVEILMGMKALLTQWGIEVLTATTVDQALELMVKQPQVLLVDYHLHDRLDGLDTLDALRENARHVPGALLTADGREELRLAARERGYLVITKPVRPASLRAFLAAHHQAN